MPLVFLCLIAGVLSSCGTIDRNNPADPFSEGSGEDEGIQLIAILPEGDAAVGGERLADFRFKVSADDMDEPLEGGMNLVGGSAKGLVLGVPEGDDRIFRVDAFDPSQIRTFSAAETLDVEDGAPEVVVLNLERLKGILEITSELPEEIITLEVVITVDGDTLFQSFEEVERPLQERIVDIPTGADIPVVLRTRDTDDQVLIERQILEDIREDLVAHVQLSIVVGALQIEAHFPGYLPIVPVDRFSDADATFFRRSEVSGLPAPGAPVNFDDEQFLLRGLGPNGESIQFYHFDVRSPSPAPVYTLVDRRDELIEGQLPIFNLIPGDPGYNDLKRIHLVKILDRDYLPNTLTSFQDVEVGGYEILPTEGVMNAIMVPDGSRASKRFDPQVPTAAQDGWYNEQIVKYLLFENPSSIAVVDFGVDEINTPRMHGFFENDKDEIQGFALDSETGGTHNVAESLPGDAGYSPLWVMQIFKLSVFDQMQNVASAINLAKNEDNFLALPALLHINAPIVQVEINP